MSGGVPPRTSRVRRDSARSAPRGRPRPRRQGLCPRGPAGRRRGRLPAVPAQPYAHPRRGAARRVRPVRGRALAQRRRPAAAARPRPPAPQAPRLARRGGTAAGGRGGAVHRTATRSSACSSRSRCSRLLLRHRDEFAALPDPRSRWRALANFVLMGAGSLGARDWSSSASTRTAWSATRAWPIASRTSCTACSASRAPSTTRADTSWTVGFSLGALGLLTAVTTIYLAFRPEHPAARLTEDDEERLRALLAKHGAPRLPRPLRAAPRQGRRLLPQRQGRRHATASSPA